MIDDRIVGIILWILLFVGAILAIGQYIGLRKVLREGYFPTKEADHRRFIGFGKAVSLRGATALHGNLDLDELRRYYNSISE